MRRNRPDIHVNQERWLVSYADFITLLFAFFVVMYSISQVNESKYRVLTQTFGDAFNPSSTKSQHQEAVEQTAPVLNPIQFDNTNTSVVTGDDLIQLNTEANDEVDTETTSSLPVDELAQISDLVSEKFSGLIEDELIHVSSNELWLQIELKDSILFASAQAEPSEQAVEILAEVAKILKNYDNPIQVEGFTDNVPIKHPKYPTNWELSTARASSIVKLLIEKGVPPQRLAAVGYGEFQPIADNSLPEGRAQNRRVTIMVAKRKMERPMRP
ncbi:MAG: flagellar motor protein MotD [Cellvibrio sp.]